jgi:hypothetical protein
VEVERLHRPARPDAEFDTQAVPLLAVEP